MSSPRGRVLKAAELARRKLGSVHGPSTSVEGPAAEVEVIRQDGRMESIEVRCRCGAVHRLNLVEETPRPGIGEEA